MKILDGKKVSNDIKNEIAAEVKKMKDKGEKVPHLAAIIVGNDGASLTYVGSKVKACERVGFESTLVQMPKLKSLNNSLWLNLKLLRLLWGLQNKNCLLPNVEKFIQMHFIWALVVLMMSSLEK